MFKLLVSIFVLIMFSRTRNTSSMINFFFLRYIYLNNVVLVNIKVVLVNIKVFLVNVTVVLKTFELRYVALVNL